MHHICVGLEEILLKYPKLEATAPDTVTLTSYNTTSPAELKSRVKDATIIIATTVKLTAEVLSQECTPRLQAIAVMAVGTDHVDLEAARARGICVFNCPNASGEVVANHAVGLYFAARRKTVMMHSHVLQEPSEWKRNGTVVRHLRNTVGDAPLVVADEICGILGYGTIGKRIEGFAKALGMKVLLSDRKGSTSTSPSSGTETPTRLPFREVLKQSTVLFVVVPKTRDTIDLISTPELQGMNPHAVIINISRGGIINEAAIVSALEEGRLAGYATDVFETEPAEGPKDSPLLAPEAKDFNITLTPHVAWFGERTKQNLSAMLKDNIEKFIAGSPQNVVA